MNTGRTHFKKGQIPWIKGRKHTAEAIEKNRLAHLGKVSWNKGLHVFLGGGFPKGSIPWNKGKKGKQKNHNTDGLLLGLGWNKGIRMESIRGENHPNWKGGVTPQNQIDRYNFSKTVKKLVFERDNYTCQMCGKRGGKLQVDHIQEWSECVELRFSIDNCRTLCKECHYKITWGKPMPVNSKWGGSRGRVYTFEANRNKFDGKAIN